MPFRCSAVKRWTLREDSRIKAARHERGDESLSSTPKQGTPHGSSHGALVQTWGSTDLQLGMAQRFLAVIQTSDQIGRPRCLSWLALSHCQTSTLRTAQRRTRPTQHLHTAFLP